MIYICKSHWKWLIISTFNASHDNFIVLSDVKKNCYSWERNLDIKRSVSLFRPQNVIPTFQTYGLCFNFSHFKIKRENANGHLLNECIVAGIARKREVNMILDLLSWCSNSTFLVSYAKCIWRRKQRQKAHGERPLSVSGSRAPTSGRKHYFSCILQEKCKSCRVTEHEAHTDVLPWSFLRTGSHLRLLGIVAWVCTSIRQWGWRRAFRNQNQEF